MRAVACSDAVRNREKEMRSTFRKRILVADCHHDSLILLEKILEDAEFDTTTVWTADEALTLLDTRAFDLLLVNEYLPDADCDDLLQVLTKKGTRLPCIIMQPSAPCIAVFPRLKAFGVLAVVNKRAYPEILAAVRKCLGHEESDVRVA